MCAAGIGEASRVGEWPELVNVDEEVPAALFFERRRRLRGRASGSRAAGARVLDDDDDVRPALDDIIASSCGQRRPRSSERWDGGTADEFASDVFGFPER